jgi:hypothetical protein
LELWKLNNLFKLFLLSFVVAFLSTIYLLHNTLASEYLLIVLASGVTVYLFLGIVPRLRTKEGLQQEPRQRSRPPKTAVIGIILIVLLFVATLLVIRYTETPLPGYQLVKFQFLTLSNGTAFEMQPFTPKNECAWLESMNVTTQQTARNEGLQDCDFAWPHASLTQPTLFLEYENFTEFAYTLSVGPTPVPPSTGTPILCFTIPNRSFQCWIPPAQVSHLR